MLEHFEKQMEDSEVKSKYLGTTLGGMVLREAPVEQVEELLTKAAEEHGLEIKHLMPQSASSALSAINANPEGDEIAERIMKLHDNT